VLLHVLRIGAEAGQDDERGALGAGLRRGDGLEGDRLARVADGEAGA
jgi:hypothetical protein